MYVRCLDLESYPLVKIWVEKNLKNFNEHMNPAERLLFKIGLLLMSTHDRIVLWVQSLKEFTINSNAHEVDFDEVINLSHSMNCDLMQVISHLTEESVVNGQGIEIYKLLHTVALRSKMPSLKFLTAWTALNIDRYQECLEHCEPIMDRYAHVYLLAGQAHMQLGEITQAIENIQIAIKLDSQDATSFFLLAKCYFVSEMIEQAFDAIQNCLAKNPHDWEACLLILLIAAHKDCSLGNRIKAMKITRDIIIFNEIPISLFLKYVEVAILVGASGELRTFLEQNRVKKKSYKLEQPYQAQELSAILKTLSLQNDYLSSRLLLDCLCLTPGHQ